MRAHAEDAAYVHLIVNEGPDAGASLEHSHAQLYALRFVPAEIARERERAAAYHERTMGGHLLADVATEEVRRRERLVAIDDEALLVCPWASRSPFELRVIPRRPAPRSSDDGEAGTAMIRTALRALAGAVRRVAAAQPLGAHRPARRRRVLLARRRRAAAHGPRRLRARHRRRGQRLPAGARGRRPARRAGGDRAAVRLIAADDAPVPRPFPRFIADAPQEGRPYGRWAERLTEEFAKACEPHAGEAGAPLDPETIAGFPSAAGAAGSTSR